MSAREERVASIERARNALGCLALAPGAVADPTIASILERERRDGHTIDPTPLLDWYASRRRSYGRDNPLRYRWSLSRRAEPGHESYRTISPREALWRPLERPLFDRDPGAYGRRLMEPVVLASQLRYWGQIEREFAGSSVGDRASDLLDEAQPTIESDLASWFLANDPWRDTFGLWLLSAEPEAIRRFRDVVFSVAVRYGGIAARDGVVRGLKHPFYRVPLVSASAHLAAGLWRMGVYPTVIPDLLALLRLADHTDGGWADANEPADVLTTLAAAEILSRLDPSFDPEPTIAWFIARQEPGGWWRALGPEVPWLTSAVVDWLEMAAQPFPERFNWPSAPVWARDRLTGLTTVATLDELEHVFSSLPSLSALPIEVAFLDLAGFGSWNSQHGQSRGDELLSLLGAALAELPGCLAVRIGGDEFLIMGKPGREGLAEQLEGWRGTWPTRLLDAGMPADVPPRFLLGRGRTRDLGTLRRQLGVQIGGVKALHPMPSPDGVLVELEHAD
jgi:hypothetical protein